MRRCVILVVALSAGLALPAVGSSSRYVDASGENATAPDVTVVIAGPIADGRIEIVAEGTGLPGFGEAGAYLFVFDTDRNAATGALFGAEVIIGVDPETLQVFRLQWDGSAYQAVEGSTPIRVLFGAERGGIAINPVELGGAQTFNFAVLVARGEIAVETTDLAGPWPYPNELEEVQASFSAKTPRASAVFRVTGARVKLTNDEVVQAETFTCSATLAGKRLRGTGNGGCTFKIPKTARRKQLKINIAARYGGEDSTFQPYTFRVR